MSPKKTLQSSPTTFMAPTPMLEIATAFVLEYIMVYLDLTALLIKSMKVLKLFSRLSNPKKFIMAPIKMALFPSLFELIMETPSNPNHLRCWYLWGLWKICRNTLQI